MRRITIVLALVGLVSAIGLGVVALAAPNLPAGCDPCPRPFDPTVICPLEAATVQGFNAGGRLVGTFFNRCLACRTPSVFCTLAAVPE